MDDMNKKLLAELKGKVKGKLGDDYRITTSDVFIHVYCHTLMTDMQLIDILKMSLRISAIEPTKEGFCIHFELDYVYSLKN